MKFRTILLASAAVMFAGSAAAADLTNPFYLPGQGEFTSDTSVNYSRNKFKHGWGVDEQWSATEEVQYGVTDNFAVKAAINNEFDTQGEYNNDHNFDVHLLFFHYHNLNFQLLIFHNNNQEFYLLLILV